MVTLWSLLIGSPMGSIPPKQAIRTESQKFRFDVSLQP
jgi:hypothetical protein